MNRVQQIRSLLSDGQPRTIEQILAAVPNTDRTQALGSIGHMLKRGLLTSSHTYSVTVDGMRASANRLLSPAERQARKAEAKRQKAQQRREGQEKLKADRAAAEISKAARGIVATALTNPHPLHAAWGGARQGAGA